MEFVPFTGRRPFFWKFTLHKKPRIFLPDSKAGLENLKKVGVSSFPSLFMLPRGFFLKALRPGIYFMMVKKKKQKKRRSPPAVF